MYSTPLYAEQIHCLSKNKSQRYEHPIELLLPRPRKVHVRAGSEQGQAGTPFQSNCRSANCRFHSWVELSKGHPSTLSSGVLSWCSFSPTITPSKTVYRWKDVATVHTVLQTSQSETGISKVSLWRSPHAHGHYHKDKAFYGRGGSLLAWMFSAAILPVYFCSTY